MSRAALDRPGANQTRLPTDRPTCSKPTSIVHTPLKLERMEFARLCPMHDAPHGTTLSSNPTDTTRPIVFVSDMPRPRPESGEPSSCAIEWATTERRRRTNPKGGKKREREGKKVRGCTSATKSGDVRACGATSWVTTGGCVNEASFTAMPCPTTLGASCQHDTRTLPCKRFGGPLEGRPEMIDAWVAQQRPKSGTRIA